MRTVQVIISGRVQGVGYRHWCSSQAIGLGLSGWVRNLTSGEVEAVFCGEDKMVDLMVSFCEVGPVYADVTSVDLFNIEDITSEKFEILKTAVKKIENFTEVVKSGLSG